MTDDAEISFEGRRYSAVAVSHSSLDSIADLRVRVPGMSFGRKKTKAGGGVTAVQGEWSHEKNLYPYGSILRRASRPASRDSQFKHRFFVAQIPSGDSSATPTFLFAAPHIRVVGFWATTLSQAVENPRPMYSLPHLDPLFEALGTSATPFRATQITLQMPSDVDVEKVALTGKSPLISSLRAQLTPVTRPYAVRLEVPAAERPLKFHMDRHGNFWWHQANENAFATAAQAMALLRKGGYLGNTRDLPHHRVEPTDT